MPTLKELVATYNTAATTMGEKPVSKFPDRSTAERRVAALTQITNYEDATWRRARLHRVMGSMIVHHGVEKVCEKIKRLHDHKGRIQVTWFSNPDVERSKTLTALWELENEPAEYVEHEGG